MDLSALVAIVLIDLALSGDDRLPGLIWLGAFALIWTSAG